jgi:iron complex outermembrane receptor protein
MMFNQNYAFAYDGSQSSLTFDNPGVATDPTAYKTRRVGDQAGGIEYTTTVDKEDYVQIDADRPINFGKFDKILFGVHYTDHVNSQESRGNTILVTEIKDLTAFSPSLSPTNLFDGVGSSGDLARMVVPSQDAVVDYLLSLPDAPFTEKKGQEWYVREQNASAYAQANFSSDGYRGNIGVRVVNTTDESKYWNYDSATGTYSRVKKETEYTKVLPSFNFVLDLAKDLVLRTGISQVIARPRYSDLAGQFELDNTRLTGGGGNPDLKPYESNNVNIALEWYPTKTSIISTELFARNISNYIIGVTQDRVLLNTATGQNATYSINSPFNAGSAQVRGIAFTVQQDIAYGFGIQANATFSDADTTNGYNMPYLSKTTYNLIPYFEKGPFSARVSYNWRSEFFTSIGRLNSPMFSDSYKQLDASMSYQITKNIQIVLNAANILDSTYFAYYQTKYAPMGVYKTGRVLSTSVNFKF